MENNIRKGFPHLNHGLIMLLCCLVPLVLILVVSVFKIPLGTIGIVAMVLLCPLLHIVMMRGMMKGHGHGGHQAAINEQHAHCPTSEGQQMASIERLPSPNGATASKEKAAS